MQGSDGEVIREVGRREMKARISAAIDRLPDYRVELVMNMAERSAACHGVARPATVGVKMRAAVRKLPLASSKVLAACCAMLLLCYVAADAMDLGCHKTEKCKDGNHARRCFSLFCH